MIDNITRIEARLTDRRFFQGSPCNTCGNTLRRVSNRECYNCKLAWQRRKPIQAEDIDLIGQLIEAGLPLAQISKKFNTTVKEIRQCEKLQSRMPE